jgi:hypothetical protein
MSAFSAAKTARAQITVEGKCAAPRSVAINISTDKILV